MTDKMDIDAGQAQPPASFGTMESVIAKEYPRKLIESITVSLEEGWNSGAIDMLCHVSYAGLSTQPRKGMKKEILVPPPEVLSILTTMALHPMYTTRQSGTLQLDASEKASRYLRTIVRLAGATNCKLQQAWKFRRLETKLSSEDEGNTTRRMRNRNVAKGAGGRKAKKTHVDIDTTPFANLSIAQEENLFSNAEDIWAVIGWALVCSCCCKPRWSYWKDFLELLLETLESDLQERTEAAESWEDVDLKGSLIYSIGFSPDMVGGAGYKRVFRAIFANGSEKSRNEWTPVFKNETKKLPKKEGLKDWGSTIEKNLYVAKKPSSDELAKVINENSDAWKEFKDKLAKGAYDHEFVQGGDPEDDMFKPTDNKKEDKTKLETDQEAVDAWGGIESIIMRQKLMALVSTIGVVRDLFESKQKRIEAEVSGRRRKKSKTPSSDENPEADSPISIHPLSSMPPIEGGSTLKENTTKGDLDGSTSHPQPSFRKLELTLSPNHISRKRRFSSAASNLISSESSTTAPAQPAIRSFTALLSINETSSKPASQTFPNLKSFPSDMTPSFVRFYRRPTLLQNLPPDPNNPQLSYIFGRDTESLRCFYEEYVDYIRSMPIKQLKLFTASGITTSSVDPAFRATLIMQILRKSMVWQPKFGWDKDSVDDDSLRECYLPHFARGQDLEGQVRMGMLVEYLARLWHMNAPDNTGIIWSEDMQRATEDGIAVRREKAEAALSKRKKRTEADEELLQILKMAETRLNFLMQHAKRTTQKGVK